ncbi:MAG: hypothetical protein J5759_03990 [Bacteroidales bacterium]|nr:hypothetical protein [Bacteroidales bacterium]
MAVDQIFYYKRFNRHKSIQKTQIEELQLTDWDISALEKKVMKICSLERTLAVIKDQIKHEQHYQHVNDNAVYIKRREEKQIRYVSTESVNRLKATGIICLKRVLDIVGTGKDIEDDSGCEQCSRQNGP